MARVKNGPPGPSISAKIGPPLQKLARARRHLVGVSIDGEGLEEALDDAAYEYLTTEMDAVNL